MTAFKYYLGLDMGTNSVGWAATDPGYRLLKAKGKDLWGIREFNEASGAVERRTHRISRRRRQREQVRIGILKDYFHDAICEVDPGFFQRLENSKYHEEDKDVEVRYKNNIFNDSNYTDKDYFNEYPTIYHLRNELISSTEKHDVRLVFLALLNMFKHRGHFLNAGLGENNGESNIDNAYFELTELLSELTEYHLSQDIDCKQIEAILSRRDMSRTHKAEELAGVLHVDLKNKPYKELIRGLCGLKFNACVVFPDVQSEEVTKLDICLSESTFDEKSDEIANIIGEDYFEIIMAMKEMFDMSYRYMRIMVLFDLPVLTEKQRRDYREFRKYLLKAGFFMMQESVYCKLVQNAGVADVVQESIRKNKPGEGLVQILRVTEKQFAKMEYVVGENKSLVLDTDERLVIL